MPRKYSMQRRTAAVEDTRQRIIDATVELHNEKGVLATSMQDIAARAGVALGTVYRHFPSIEDLVPACGGRNLELNPPPTAAVFEHRSGGRERLEALVSALFTHYERGARPYEVGLEAMNLPVMAGLMTELANYVRNLVEAAISPFQPVRRQQDLAVGLCDFRVWRSLTQAGLSTQAAADAITWLIHSALTTTVQPAEGSEA